jgi:hypothetical protein
MDDRNFGYNTKIPQRQKHCCAEVLLLLFLILRRALLTVRPKVARFPSFSVSHVRLIIFSMYTYIS